MKQNKMNLKEAILNFEANKLENALEILNCLIKSDQNHVDAYLLRGRIYYKKQQWDLAMNDYVRVLELHPGNKEAQTGLAMARNILGYFTPDMFNP